MKTKTLLIIFAVLLVVYLLTRLLSGNRERTFDPRIIEVDSSAVTSIVLNPKAEGGKEVRLERDNGTWFASMEGKRVTATPQTVKGILGQMTLIESKRIVAKSQDKWPEYEVDTAGTRVRAMSNGEELADFIVGGFKFDQARRSASTYIRLEGEPNVHLVDGFAGMQFNQGFQAFRNKQILKFDRNEATKVTLEQADSEALSIQNMNGDWYFAGMEQLDSARAAQYLTELSNLMGSDFTDTFEPSTARQLAEVSVDLASRATPLTVRCYASDDPAKPFVFHGSVNPDAYFLSDSAAVYNRLIGSFLELVPTGE